MVISAPGKTVFILKRGPGFLQNVVLAENMQRSIMKCFLSKEWVQKFDLWLVALSKRGMNHYKYFPDWNDIVVTRLFSNDRLSLALVAVQDELLSQTK